MKMILLRIYLDILGGGGLWHPEDLIMGRLLGLQFVLGSFDHLIVSDLGRDLKCLLEVTQCIFEPLLIK